MVSLHAEQLQGTKQGLRCPKRGSVALRLRGSHRRGAVGRFFAAPPKQDSHWPERSSAQRAMDALEILKTGRRHAPADKDLRAASAMIVSKSIERALIARNAACCEHRAEG